MPFMYKVGVQSEDIEGDEPVVFSPIAHTADQALVQIRNHLRSRGVRDGQIAYNVTVDRRIGGYDSPMVEAKMKRAS